MQDASSNSAAKAVQRIVYRILLEDEERTASEQSWHIANALGNAIPNSVPSCPSCGLPQGRECRRDVCDDKPPRHATPNSVAEIRADERRRIADAIEQLEPRYPNLVSRAAIRRLLRG